VKTHHLRKPPDGSHMIPIAPRYEGIFCGTSGGATVATALEVTFGEGKTQHVCGGVVG